MEFNSKELKNIAAKVISGTATPEEISFINQYYDVFDKEADVSEQLSSVDKIALKNEIMAKIVDKTNDAVKITHYGYRYFYKIAATIVLLFTAGYLMFNAFNQEKNKNNATANVAKDIFPGGNNATLTLADGSSYVLNKLGEKILLEKENLKIEKTKEGQLVFSILDKRVSQNALLSTITTPRGGQYEVILADGSKVLLNAGSSLKFPNSFNGSTRVVELTGEAYFEVAHLVAKPFFVKSRNVSVQVLGTHFNVTAYDHKEVKATLLEGSVNLRTNSAAEILIPGEQGIISNDNIITKKKVDADKETSWRKGWFNFNDSSIKDVMDEISRWYDVDIVYEGKIPQKEIIGRISRSVKLSVVLEMLRYSGLQFDINDKKIIVK